MLNQYLADIESGAYTKEATRRPGRGASARRPATRPFCGRPVLYTQWTNKAITSTYEPAPRSSPSSRPPPWRAWSRRATASAGYIMVEGWSRPISCSRRRGPRDQDLALAVANSSQPGLRQDRPDPGAEKFLRLSGGFGFLEKTGIDMQGEMDTSSRSGPGGLQHRPVGHASFGQRFQVTPFSSSQRPPPSSTAAT